MKEKLIYLLKIFSVPLIMLAIYLSMVLLFKMLDLPVGNEFVEIIKGYFDKYGPWMVFISALLEGFLLLGLYFPGGTIIFLGVIASGKDVSRAIEVVLIVTIAFIISYTLNYLVGKHGWYRLLIKFGLKSSLEKSQAKLQKQGLNAIMFSYWEPNLASLTATAAGILQLPFKKFQIYSIAGVVVWNAFWGILVFSLGNVALEITGFKYALIIFSLWILIIGIKTYLEKRTAQKSLET